MLPKSRNPLEPVATVVSALLALTCVGLVAAAVASFGTGSIMGIGDDVVYVDVPDLSADSDPQRGWGGWTLQADVSTNGLGYRFVTKGADFGQRVWSALTVLPGGVLFIGALLLLYRLIRGAEWDGIYTPATAGRLRTLGWFLLIGALTRMVVETVAANRLLATMVTNEVGWLEPIHWDTPWTTLLISAGLLSFARIMRIGAEMRDELQGTV